MCEFYLKLKGKKEILKYSHCCLCWTGGRKSERPGVPDSDPAAWRGDNSTAHCQHERMAARETCSKCALRSGLSLHPPEKWTLRRRENLTGRSLIKHARCDVLLCPRQLQHFSEGPCHSRQRNTSVLLTPPSCTCGPAVSCSSNIRAKTEMVSSQLKMISVFA